MAKNQEPVHEETPQLDDDYIEEIDYEELTNLRAAAARLAELEGQETPAPEEPSDDESISYEEYQRLLDAAARLAELEEPDEIDLDDEQSIDPDDEYAEEITMDELIALRAAKEELDTYKKKHGKLDAEHKKLQQMVKQYEREKLTEQERKEQEYQEAQQRLADLEKQLKTERGRRAIASAAQQFRVPATLIERLVMDELAYDDHGNPENVEQLIRATIQEHPHLVIPEYTPRSSKTNGDVSRQKKKGLTLADVEMMNEEEINERWEEIEPLLTG